MPSRTRTPNVAAAQWSPNGGALGQADLTQPGANVFGENVFSVAVQRQRLPKARLPAARRRRSPRASRSSPRSPTPSPPRCSEWAMEQGATHYTHWFQPLTGSTAEKHDSFYGPTGDGNAIAEFSGKELIQGEPDASSFPSGGIRATFEARGYTAWDPTSPAFILENPNGALLCIPTAFASWTGEALDNKIPLLRSMDALSRAAVARARAARRRRRRSASSRRSAPEQEYFLIDEQYYFERPDLVITGRTLFGAKPPKGQELDDHYFGSIPERVLACMLETEHELAKLGVPIKTRHNEVAPAQYEVAPIFENSNVGSDHQQLTMQIMQNVARRYGLVCLLHEKPFAGVNGSGKHNNWSMGTDTGINLLEPGRHAAREPAVPVLLRGRHPGRQQAPGSCCARRSPTPARTTASAPTRRRRRSSRSSSAPSWRRSSTRSRPARATRRRRRPTSSSAPRCCRALPMHGGDRNRTSPFAFTGNKFEFRALGSSHVARRCPNTVLNTIVAEAIDELADKLEAAIDGGASLEEAVLAVVKDACDGQQADRLRRRQLLRGVARRGRGARAGQPAPDPGRAAVADRAERPSRSSSKLRRALRARAASRATRSSVEQYVTTINIEAETAASIARTMLLPGRDPLAGDARRRRRRHRRRRA